MVALRYVASIPGQTKADKVVKYWNGVVWVSYMRIDFIDYSYE